MSNVVPPTSYSELADLLDSIPMLVREARRQRRISAREAARQIGFSFATLDRIEHEKGDLVVGNLTRVLRWLDQPAASDRCSSCDHLVTDHAGDGSGCLYTVARGRINGDLVCVCTGPGVSDAGS